MLLNIPKCIGQTPAPGKNFSASNVNDAQMEKTHDKSGIRKTEMGES